MIYSRTRYPIYLRGQGSVPGKRPRRHDESQACKVRVHKNRVTNLVAALPHFIDRPKSTSTPLASRITEPQCPPCVDRRPLSRSLLPSRVPAHRARNNDRSHLGRPPDGERHIAVVISEPSGTPCEVDAAFDVSCVVDPADAVIHVVRSPRRRHRPRASHWPFSWRCSWSERIQPTSEATYGCPSTSPRQSALSRRL